MTIRILSRNACLFAAMLVASVAAFGQANDKAHGTDRHFVMEAMVGGMMEVETGRLAAERATSADVKAYGQHMVDDHTKANDELKTLADGKGITMSEADHRKHMDDAAKMRDAMTHAPRIAISALPDLKRRLE